MMGRWRTRERGGYSALSAPSQARRCSSTRRGTWDDVAGKAVGMLADEAEQAVTKYEQTMAAAVTVPEEEDYGAFGMDEQEDESEEDLWAGAGVRRG